MKTKIALIALALLLWSAPCMAQNLTQESNPNELSKEKQVLDTTVSATEWQALVDKLQDEGWSNIKATKDGKNRKIHAERYTNSERKATLVSDIIDEKGVRTQIYDIHTVQNHYGLLQLSPTGDTILVSAVYMDIDKTDEQGIRTKVYDLFTGHYCIQQFDSQGKGISTKIVDKKPE